MHLHRHPTPAEEEHDIALRQGGEEHAHCAQVVRAWQAKHATLEIENRALRQRLVRIEEELARARLGIGDLREPRRAA